tara:strand:- start:475 stop:645 length:171 start_codon:yes stop_codon:yes gene_type:complete
MHGTEITTRLGLLNHTEFHQHQDFIVTTMVVSVVTGQYLKVQLLQFLNYGAVALQE